MRKIEALTLEDAYIKAASELKCSVTQLKYEIIQHPTSGILGFMKKNAIIVADCIVQETEPKDEKAVKTQITIRPKKKIVKEKKIEESSSTKTMKDILIEEKKPKELKPVKNIDDSLIKNDTDILSNFFDIDTTKVKDKELIINEFEILDKNDNSNNQELEVSIQKDIVKLLSYSCYNIDTVEVSIEGNIVKIYLDGIDTALLIGKEGHRYNAFSYMLFNWLQSKHNLYVKLEIAQFLASQKEMIKNYIQPVIEHIHKNGRGKTRSLDGILSQLALEELREEFPHKYVAIKTSKDGNKYIVINDFSSPKKNLSENEKS